jgi:hypothetical protein
MSKSKAGAAGVSFTERPQFELLCLANHVEAINGLLYMTGGGWTEHHRPPLQPNGQTTISHVGIAVMVRIPWNETNRPHRFQVEIQDLDGSSLMKVEGDLNVGRPPQIVPGTAQHACLAINGELVFPRAGSYVLRAVLNGDIATKRTWEFRVHDIAMLPMPQQHP